MTIPNVMARAIAIQKASAERAKEGHKRKSQAEMPEVDRIGIKSGSSPSHLQFVLSAVEPDDVRHRIAIPALGKHSNAHDAAHVAARRVQRSIQFLRKRM